MHYSGVVYTFFLLLFFYFIKKSFFVGTPGTCLYFFFNSTFDRTMCNITVPKLVKVVVFSISKSTNTEQSPNFEILVSYCFYCRPSIGLASFVWFVLLFLYVYFLILDYYLSPLPVSYIIELCYLMMAVYVEIYWIV